MTLREPDPTPPKPESADEEAPADSAK